MCDLGEASESIMRILLDCVVTSKDPAQCSTNIQYITFVERTLAKRSDVFFYWLIPEWADEYLKKSYPRHPNIRYVTVPQHKDRTKEYLTISKALDHAVAFNGGLWDYDVLLTMRTGLVPLLKMLGTSPRNHRLHWLRKIWLIEAMVLMDFKTTVLTFSPNDDLFTLSGYVSADMVLLTSQSDKTPIVQAARNYFTPSHVRAIAEKVVPVGYGSFLDPVLKTKDQYPDASKGKKFCLAHAGRMEKANRIDEINDLMVKNYVMLGDNIKLLVCTVSTGIKSFDLSVVDVKQSGREEFWELAKEDMHLIVNMSDEAGSALSVLEPMMFGVPAILGGNRKRMEDAIGDDYPFLVNNETEAYAFVKMFFEDYTKMYAQWAAWQKARFVSMLKSRNEEKSVFTMLGNGIDEYPQTVARFVEARPGLEENQMVVDMLDFLGVRKEFVFVDLMAEMKAARKVDGVILAKLRPEDRDYRGLVWCTDFNLIRNILRAFHGWDDASTVVGHMRKV